MTDPSNPRYGVIDRDYGLRLATTPDDDDGPVWMLNLMKYRARADYADGRPTDISGREADDLYTPLDALAGVGAELVFAADVEAQPAGDSVRWDRVAVVKYPTRRSFIEMQSRPDFQEKHVHKDAGMQQTIVIGCQPESAPAQGDGPLTNLEVVRLDTSDQAANVPVGPGSDVWFSVEGTILGDGRTWHRACFGTSPAEQRSTAVVDRYRLVLRPTLDRLRESIDGGAQ